MTSADPAAAQVGDPGSPDPARWGIVDALGYGGLGFGLGLAATWDLEGSGFGPPGETVAIVAAATGVGVLAGGVLGSRAERAITDARPLSGAHRAAVMAGGVAAGGTLGALAAVPLVNAEGEGTPLGSDEQTVFVLVAAGVAVGSLFVASRRDELAGRRVVVAPVIDRGGALGVRFGL